MMEETVDNKKLTKQLTFCSFCRLSHKKWKKHVYSKRHQEIMAKVLKKFVSKVMSARDTIDNPSVESTSFENHAKVWCYFCAEDVDKHTHADSYTIKFGAFIDHLSSDNHVMMTNKFLHSNLLDKNKLSELVLDNVQLKSFKENAGRCVLAYEEQMKKALRMEAEKIKAVEYNRQMAARRKLRESEARCKQISDSMEHSVHPAHRTSHRRTTMATGEGLTSVLKAGEDGPEEGNIFSGAVPPWLRPDPDLDTGHKQIGPTMEDFQKHLKLEKKKKLPPNRVGANFDHSATTSDQWLPSFGRVWSKGRQLQSKNYFEKQIKPGRGVMSSNRKADITALRGNGNSLPMSIQPYQRKRPPSSTVTTETQPSVGTNIYNAVSSALHSTSGTPQTVYHAGNSRPSGLSQSPIRAVNNSGVIDSLSSHQTVNFISPLSTVSTTEVQPSHIVNRVTLVREPVRSPSVHCPPGWDNSKHRIPLDTKRNSASSHSPVIQPYKRKRLV